MTRAIPMKSPLGTNIERLAIVKLTASKPLGAMDGQRTAPFMFEASEPVNERNGLFEPETHHRKPDRRQSLGNVFDKDGHEPAAEYDFGASADDADPDPIEAESSRDAGGEMDESELEEHADHDAEDDADMPFVDRFRKFCKARGVSDEDFDDFVFDFDHLMPREDDDPMPVSEMRGTKRGQFARDDEDMPPRMKRPPGAASALSGDRKRMGRDRVRMAGDRKRKLAMDAKRRRIAEARAERSFNAMFKDAGRVGVDQALRVETTGGRKIATDQISDAGFASFEAFYGASRIGQGGY